MRTLVDLPKEDMEALDRVSAEERTSRAAIIRSAVSDYLKERDRLRRKAAREAGIGLWKDLDIDGLEYQEMMRAEWDRDPAA